MINDFLKDKSQASTEKSGYVTYGYGQVEPNHLSAQRTAQIYAQLPTAEGIDLLENGQFVKYDYATNGGEVNFTGKGEWMLVFNEIKLYRENQMDCEFAMKKGNYINRVYSPVNGDTNFDAQSRYYGSTDPNPTFETQVRGAGGVSHGGTEVMDFEREKIIAPEDKRELNYTMDPFHIESQTSPAMMKNKDAMVPRVFKTNIGDIMTTNMVKAKTLEVGNLLTPGSDGILATAGATADGSNKMVWQVVKVYTLPDHQKAVKIMRIQ